MRWNSFQDYPPHLLQQDLQSLLTPIQLPSLRGLSRYHLLHLWEETRPDPDSGDTLLSRMQVTPVNSNNERRSALHIPSLEEVVSRCQVWPNDHRRSLRKRINLPLRLRAQQSTKMIGMSARREERLRAPHHCVQVQNPAPILLRNRVLLLTPGRLQAEVQTRPAWNPYAAPPRPLTHEIRRPQLLSPDALRLHLALSRMARRMPVPRAQ